MAADGHVRRTKDRSVGRSVGRRRRGRRGRRKKNGGCGERGNKSMYVNKTRAPKRGRERGRLAHARVSSEGNGGGVIEQALAQVSTAVLVRAAWFSPAPEGSCACGGVGWGGSSSSRVQHGENKKRETAAARGGERGGRLALLLFFFFSSLLALTCSSGIITTPGGCPIWLPPPMAAAPHAEGYDDTVRCRERKLFPPPPAPPLRERRLLSVFLLAVNFVSE